MNSTVKKAKKNVLSSKGNAFWRGFVDALLGPKSKISGVRRSFLGRSWRTKLGLLLFFASILSGLATYAALTKTPPFGDDPDTVIWLLNLDLILLLAFGVLVARKIASVWSGRRKNIAGSKLHVRLVVIFSIMAALPAILMAIFSSFFFHFGVQSWFSDNVRTAVFDSQVVAEAYLEEHQQVIKADILAMANDIDRQAALMMDANAAYNRVLDTQSLIRNLSEALIFDGNGKILARSGLTFTLTFEKVPDYLMDRAKNGEVVVLTSGSDDRVRALTKLNSGRDNFLFVGRQVDPVVLSYLTSAKDATERYSKLEQSYSQLQIIVTLIFLVVALLLLLAAIWFGIVLARQLVSPISSLIFTSERVRAGDLEARVPEGKQIEEFDYLAQSFNRMTLQLQQQRDELISTNRQLDERRRLTETVLTGVPAGVMGVNKSNKITFANTMAMELFEPEQGKLVNLSILELMPEIKTTLNSAYEQPQKISQIELPYKTKSGTQLILNIRIAIELIGDVDYGAVLTFDDITELQSAQRKAAWADVARRIAHEIKNPLTPIQLSAERLQRKYLPQIHEDKDTFLVCTDTIIRHVGDIGRMVNEFSDFARMPEPIMTEVAIISEIQELLIFQKAAHPNIKFNIINNVDDIKMKMACDSQQIRQAVTNLMQNAIDSVTLQMEKDETFKGHLKIITEQKNNMFYFVITDNGIGFPKEQSLNDLAEPYITYKEKGTGLGLAIVKKIMADHNGKLQMGSNKEIENLTSWSDLGGATVGLIFSNKKNKV